jgi:hypothetical protein
MSDTTAAPATVVAVLLADGWHRVVPGSFSVGPLNFGAEAGLGMPGFRFEEADPASPYRPTALAGPLASILAVRQVSSADYLSAVNGPGDRRGGHPAQEAFIRQAPRLVKSLSRVVAGVSDNY